MFFQIAVVMFLVFMIYLKHFEDELLSEGTESATVIEVQDSNSNAVGVESVRVQVQLDDGARANTFYRMSVPAVGQSVQVKVRTYESGKRNVSAVEF